jgi:hypothetical protein
VADLALAVRAVDRHHDQPEAQRRDVRDHECARGARAHHDAIAGAQTRAGKPPGDPA